MHVSRLAEELVLWSTSEFGFIRIGEGFTTGSSIMPQKRNPDLAELARGKAGRTYGNLMAVLTTLKSLPLSYNRDLQEDKEGLFDTVDTVKDTLRICAAMLRTVEVDARRMREAIRDYVLATDVADYLVRKGMPFRTAHGVSAAVSRYAQDNRKSLAELSVDEYRRFSTLFEADIADLSLEQSVAARDVPGGTAPSRVAAAMAAARTLVDAEKRNDRSIG
jgi:argininosuccinate lyase